MKFLSIIYHLNGDCKYYSGGFVKADFQYHYFNLQLYLLEGKETTSSVQKDFLFLQGHRYARFVIFVLEKWTNIFSYVLLLLGAFCCRLIRKPPHKILTLGKNFNW